MKLSIENFISLVISFFREYKMKEIEKYNKENL